MDKVYVKIRERPSRILQFRNMVRLLDFDANVYPRRNAFSCAPSDNLIKRLQALSNGLGVCIHVVGDFEFTLCPRMYPTVTIKEVTHRLRVPVKQFLGVRSVRGLYEYAFAVNKDVRVRCDAWHGIYTIRIQGEVDRFTERVKLFERVFGCKHE